MTDYADLEKRLREQRDRLSVGGDLEKVLDDAAYSIGVLTRELDEAKDALAQIVRVANPHQPYEEELKRCAEIAAEGLGLSRAASEKDSV